MALLRSEFGPSLPDLLAPRLRTTPRRVRRVVAALVALVLVVLLVGRIVDPPGSSLANDAVVAGLSTPFTLGYGPGLQRVPPGRGELVRLQTPVGAQTPQSFVATAFRLPAYAGDQAGILPTAAAVELQALRRQHPDGFRFRGDGRTRLNDVSGHQVLFQATIDGLTTYGRRVIILRPTDPPSPVRDGVRMTLLSARSPAVPNVDAVGNNGLLKGPLRSFRFGTERP